MAFVLRVDVDKPYGRANFIKKVMSKVREDYWFPAVPYFGYLLHFKQFLSFLSKERIKAHIYFRKCTLPPKDWISKLFLDGHMIGLHAENTRNYDTFNEEFKEVQAYFGSNVLSSFTKHGSGQLKLGRHHYPPYEPDQYLKWSDMSGLPYIFGNGIVNESDDFVEHKSFYPGMFWIDKLEENRGELSFQWVIDAAKEKTVVVIIHPANFMADKLVESDLRKLVTMSRQQNVLWTSIDAINMINQNISKNHKNRDEHTVS